ncbi:hypothetical protein GN956_G14602 [Arapaima gigas]
MFCRREDTGERSVLETRWERHWWSHRPRWCDKLPELQAAASCSVPAMQAARGARPTTPCARRPSLATLTAVYAALLLLSASVACARGSTLRHEPHTGHNVDNRSPEIDPFWYVGRGVRPIGRFGKRQSAGGGLGPLTTSLELLLGSLRGKELRGLAKMLAGEDADWLP